MRSFVTLQSDDATVADAVSIAPHDPFSAQVILISLTHKVSHTHTHTHTHTLCERICVCVCVTV